MGSPFDAQVASIAPGLYITKADTYLTSEKVPNNKNIKLTLPFGTLVTVVEVQRLHEIDRVRGRIVDPPGWITLVDTSSTTIWCEKQDIQCGKYCVLAGSTSVTSGKRPSRDTIIHELLPGTDVVVVEVEHLTDISRVRGRIVDPPGWITILHTRRGYRWAAPLDGNNSSEAVIVPHVQPSPPSESVPFIDTDGDSNLIAVNLHGGVDLFVNEELALTNITSCSVNDLSLTLCGIPSEGFDFDGTLIAEVPEQQRQAIELVAELVHRVTRRGMN
eukprot:TRINITY_DN66070_c0_g1_i1.p1 TRINITY_DN66070_c0_g1~~TRINITY_DN66070_c0_g1_i1.p1  ORF type:complete len:302 (+),score=39.55 TRINITY_DN66070_c0_g1_i1:85-906(+)